MTFDKIKTLIADHLDIDEDEITLDTTFEDLGIDSLDTVELMMEVEDEFGVEISDDQQEKLRTVQNAIDFIVANGN